MSEFTRVKSFLHTKNLLRDGSSVAGSDGVATASTDGDGVERHFKDYGWGRLFPHLCPGADCAICTWEHSGESRERYENQAANNR